MINGDIRDPARLFASPGSDGISLREAITAVNNGTTPIEITFASTLIGQTITLNSPLPFLRCDGTTVLGLLGSDNQPGVTLNGSGINVFGDFSILTVAASSVTIARLRFTDITQGNSAIFVLAGSSRLSPDRIGGPQDLTNVKVEDNKFDNSPRITEAYAVRIGTDHPASATRIARVTVARNSFHHFRGNATTVMLHGHGERGLIESVDIHDNAFSECSFCVELVHVGGSDNAIRETRVVRNSFVNIFGPVMALGNANGVNLPNGARNSIARTLISENRFIGHRRGALSVSAGYAGASGNSVSSLWFFNNVVANGGGGVLILAGTDGVGGGATNNRVENVRIAHSTFYGTNASLNVIANDGNVAGNTVSDVSVVNTIFWNTGDILGVVVTPQHVYNSITRQAGFTGTNGSFNLDPLFVAPAANDFRLQSNSPAIDKGISQCLIAADLFCRPRVGLPDIGAIEFGSTQSSCGNSLPAFPQPCALAALSLRGACLDLNHVASYKKAYLAAL